MASGILTDKGIFLGGGGEGHAAPQELLLRYANRHGLIAGATGTGKTVTLQVLAEGFSAAGVPVFLADVKGDLAGLAFAGSESGKLHEPFVQRAATIGYDLAYRDFPVTFWDIFGAAGHPVRATVTEMGPLLLARLMGLSEPQEGVLNIAFRLADDEGLPLLDLRDLQAMLVHIGENAEALGLRYGHVSAASVGAIQRALLTLENQGGAGFFGEPALDLADLMQVTPEGLGRINILAADKLMQAPRLYSTFLLWLLSELFEELPEVGDAEKPRLVFFFDEAHLLFDEAPKALIDKVEQVARLIRSKGVGVYFITQNPGDVPPSVLGQMGNRVQHALRAYTAQDQKALVQAAATYRLNPRLDLVQVIREVAVGEALTSMLGAKGEPGMAERTLIRPPASRLGTITPEERAGIMARAPFGAKYDQPIDRESAHERLARRAEAAAGAAGEDPDDGLQSARRYAPRGAEPDRAPRRRSDSIVETFGKSVARQIGSSAGRAIVRGILGSLFKSR